MCGYSAEVYPHNKGIGWRMNKCIEANPFTGVTGTGTELLRKVTPVHCCIELDDKIWHQLKIDIPLADLGGVPGARPPEGPGSFVSAYKIFEM